MKLSIILLTWNSEQFIENCINSLYNNNVEQEIIIIDNGSTDNTLKIIKEKYPNVKLIKNTTNRGVAPARNQGIKEANGEYILILDIDTIVKENSIKKLVKYLDDNKNVGICGPKLVFSDGTVQNSCRKFPLVHTKILRRVPTNWADKILQDEYYIEQKNKQEPFTVDYIIGACQLVRREALDQVGLLDEKIFYGPEDVDFCLRMWLKGWKVVYLPDSEVIHLEQRITRKKFFSYITLKHILGLIYYFFKHRYFFNREELYKRIRV